MKDFKDHISVKGNYRYSFKALDPEFGTVKEEVKMFVIHMVTIIKSSTNQFLHALHKVTMTVQFDKGISILNFP